MTDRDIQKDRLKKLLKEADESASNKLIMDYDDAIDDNADYLLANGVIVPPYKVDTKVYVITSQTSNNKNFYIFEDIITHYRIFDGCTTMCFEEHLGVCNWNWDKVFLTKEEAEEKLKELGK